ncbi:MAG: low molecular weight phosphotyrosine protein phosphatase, partial [Burkholderiaceae bacterium]|nr:low molecular weight phosphotyrosine protein phosphatase [Burkholderiaceae bacterium]
MVKVLFVCMGNICRSPTAEAVFRATVEKAGLSDAFEIDSCGTENYHVGETADDRSIREAAR